MLSVPFFLIADSEWQVMHDAVFFFMPTFSPSMTELPRRVGAPFAVVKSVCTPSRR